MKFELALLTLASTTWAAPSIGYSFNKQYPPIARYNQQYSYQLSSDTFSSSDDSEVKYTAKDLPDWLKFEESSRTLHGSSPSNDNNDDLIKFTIVGSDGTGETPMDCELQMTNSPAPISTEDALVSTLRKAGPVAGIDGLVLTPNEQFSIQFPKDFYKKGDNSNTDIKGYTALSATHSPLPIWLNFDESSLTFTGTAPSIQSDIAPAQNFEVSLIVIDHDGFTSTETKFQLVVGAHQLTTNVTVDSVNVTKEKEFKYNIPFDRMSLDGKPLGMQDVSSIEINSTEWLKVDQSAGKIIGTVPSDVSDDQAFQVRITDKFSDFLDYTLMVKTDDNTTTLFNSKSLNSVNATTGEFFSYSLKNALKDKDAKVSTKFNPPANWVKYHSSNQSFTGVVPSKFDKTVVTVSAADNSKDSTKFTILGNKKNAKMTESSSTVKSKPTKTASSTPSSTTTSSSAASNKTVAIVCGTVIPICVLSAIAVLFFFCRRKRNQSPKDRSISPPILPDQDVEKNPETPKDNGVPPSNSKESYNMMWESPQKVLALNFMKMDSSGEDLNYYSSSETHVGSPSTNHSHEQHYDEDKTPVIGSRPDNSEEITDRPRNSWRQPEQEGRWQEHKSVGSLATINTDELLTMRLVDRQSGDSSSKVKTSSNRNTYMSPTRSRVLTPHQSMIREESSGNFQQLGSHSSSLNEVASSNDNNNTQYDTIKEEEPESNHDLANYYKQALNYSQSSFQSDNDEDDNQIYRTASSGSEFESMSEDDNSIRPYRNSRGEMTWSQLELDRLAREGSSSKEEFESPQQRFEDVQEPLQHYPTNTPSSNRFSFQPHSGQTNINRDSRQTLRLVDNQDRRSAQLTPDQVSLNESPRIPKSSSAELAFL